MAELDLYQRLENIVERHKNKNVKRDLTVVITYSTGEKEEFPVSIVFWANSILSTKNRLKFLYFETKLISLDHVVKMEYQGLERYLNAEKGGMDDE